MTDEELNALVERLERTIYHPSAGELIPTKDELDAASAIRQLMSEREEALEVMARIEHEAIIRQPAAAVQTVSDLRAIAREFLIKHQPPSEPNRP